jgi:hypothetical protein
MLISLMPGVVDLQNECRKALEDSQPRVRGRFAKIEECDLLKPSK